MVYCSHGHERDTNNLGYLAKILNGEKQHVSADALALKATVNRKPF
jgi:hypothetical protein